MTSPEAHDPNKPAAAPLGRQWVLGTPLTLTTYDGFITYCLAAARQDRTTAVDFSNTHIITLRRHDLAFRAATDSMDFFIPDGMPLIWCLNSQGAHLGDRVYGPTFMRQLLASTPAGYTHYFLGGSPECLAKLKENMVALNPGAAIVGSHHGYFGADEEAAIVEEINRLAPDFIWVGLGTPKQQFWIQRTRSQVRHGVLFAVGFAFDVNAGTKRDAPPWMQRAGLTWLYRMMCEPRRLFPRFVRFNSLFLFYLLKDILRGRAFKDPHDTPAARASV